MTATELIQTSGLLHVVVDKYYWYELPRKDETVQIMLYAIDCRSHYGKAHINCTPVFGTGTFWITSDKLQYIDNPTIFINKVNGQREISLSGNQIITALSPYIPNLENREGIN